MGAKDALKIRGSLARADLPVPEFFSRNKAQIPLGSTSLDLPVRSSAKEVMVVYHFIAKKIVALEICFFADGTPKPGY